MDEKPTLLIVDDTPGNIKVLADILRMDYDVRMALNGEEALDAVTIMKPDMILLDIIMPGLNGYEVCQQLKADTATRSIPIIFITSIDEPWDEFKGLQLGAVDFITKPVRPALVQARVKSHLELKRQRDTIQTLANTLEQRVQEEISKHQHTEFRYKMLVETMRDGFAVIDTETRFVLVNERLSDITGYPRQALIGQPVTQFLDAKAQTLFLEQIKRRRGGADDLYELYFTKRTGKQLHLLISPRPLFDQQGVFEGSFATITDITERRQAENALQTAHDQLARINEALIQEIRDHKRSEEEKLALQEHSYRSAQLASLGEISANISHEINNPNMAIGFNAETLIAAWKDVAALFEECRNDLVGVTVGGLPIQQAIERFPLLEREILKNSHRIRDIIETLKQMARPDSGCLDEQVEICAVLRGVVTILEPRISKHTDAFSLEIPGQLPPVRGNRQQLEQVFLNVILNALQSLQARSDAVQVGTSIESENHRLTIRVEDDGVGIPAENLEVITDPFFSTKLESGGTGLGLSITTTILEHHHGTIAFDSTVGHGTRVTITLPLDNSDREACSV
ncbi:MAG: response regulator [Magnetococcales bacterium]|nr:response regulator [Magnetococcales bacterium]